MTRYLVLIACSIILASCGAELAPLDPEPECVKTWTVEINNPEATVKIVEGKLIVDIENPKTAQDVRLIQYQDEGSLTGEIGVGITATLEVVPINETANPNDAHIKVSFAYQQNPNQPFLSKVKSTYGSRGYSMGTEIYRSFAPDYFAFYATGTEVKFNRISSATPLIEIPQVSSAAKICYLDFGINPIYSGVSPTKSIHAEIDIVAFADYTESGVNLVSSYNQVGYGFRVDDFFCNTLK